MTAPSQAGSRVTDSPIGWVGRRSPRSYEFVDLIGRCSNHRFTGKSLEDLRRLNTTIADADSVDSFEVAIRDVNRRLGRDTIRQLVLEYRRGRHTTELTATYGISKSSVLRLLRENNVEMRRKGVSPQQAAAARVLYETEGMSLASVARELNLAKQSVRLALLDLGVAMRPSGGSLPRDR